MLVIEYQKKDFGMSDKQITLTLIIIIPKCNFIEEGEIGSWSQLLTTLTNKITGTGKVESCGERLLQSNIQSYISIPE